MIVRYDKIGLAGLRIGNTDRSVQSIVSGAETKKIHPVPTSAMAGSIQQILAPLIQSSFWPPLFFSLVCSLRFPSLLAWRDFPFSPRNETKRAMSPIMSSG